jgi:putative transposase
MSKSKHTEAAMIAALKQVEAGRKVEDVAREVGRCHGRASNKARR